MKRFGYTLVIAALSLWSAVPAAAQSVTFDFDSGTPALTTGQNIPFDQTMAGVTASFSSPSGAAFSLQSDSTTGWHMAQFSGNYIYDNNQNKNLLDIRFSQKLTSVTLTFATADFQQVEVPTTVQLDAYVDSTTSTRVGTITAHGSYGGSTMPMGKITFSSTQPFNLVEFSIAAGQPLGAAAFFVDNVVATPASAGGFSIVSAATLALGATLAPGSISTAFGSALATGVASATTLPLPTTLAATSVSVRDSAGVTRLAPLFMVSPNQINYQVPDGTASGTAVLTVTNGTQTPAAGTLTIGPVAPGIFTANADGAGAPAAQAVSVAPDQTQTVLAVAQCGTTFGSCVTTPIDLGPTGTTVILVLYGTGIQKLSSMSNATVTIGGANSQVLYAGSQVQYAGLDQVNVVIPRSLAGQGEVSLILTVDGKVANTVKVNIK